MNDVGESTRRDSFRIPLGDGGSAVLTVTWPMNQDAYETLIAWLQLAKPGIVYMDDGIEDLPLRGQRYGGEG